MDSQILIYIIKANISILIFAAIYAILIGRDSNFVMRRAYLIASLIASLAYQFFPSIWSGSAAGSVESPTLPIMESLSINMDGAEAMLQSSNGSIFGWAIVAIWAVITSLMALKVVVGVIHILRIRSRSVKHYYEGDRFYYVNRDITPFSIFGWIFLPSDEYDSQSDVLIHEQSHCRGMHSLDLIIGEIFTLLFWYNPAVWYLRSEVRENLEYLADRDVLLSGRDKKEYQYGLLRLCYREDSSVATYFNNSNLKKRIIMMNRERRSRLAILKYGILPIAFLMLTLTNQASGSNKTDPDVKVVASGSMESNANITITASTLIIQTDSTKVGKEPLLIVDKVEQKYETFNKIDPNTIQSITVLKDAAAIETYGEKGENGVIIVTTKEE